MNRNFVAFLAICCLTLKPATASVESHLRHKLHQMLPQFNQELFTKVFRHKADFAIKWPRTIPASQLAQVVNEQQAFHIPNGQLMDPNQAKGDLTNNYMIKPFLPFAPLMWGAHFEKLHLEHHIRVRDVTSIGLLRGAYGVREGANIVMISGIGYTWGKLRKMENEVKYKKCKRRLFGKKCKWEKKKIERGLTLDEIHNLQNTMIHYGGHKIISILSPTRILEGQEGEQREATVADLDGHHSRQILGQVDKSNLLTAIEEMISSKMHPRKKRDLLVQVGKKDKIVVHHKNEAGQHRIHVHKRAHDEAHDVHVYTKDLN